MKTIRDLYEEVKQIEIAELRDTILQHVGKNKDLELPQLLEISLNEEKPKSVFVRSMYVNEYGTIFIFCDDERIKLVGEFAYGELLKIIKAIEKKYESF
jgi:hypothetical protein